MSGVDPGPCAGAMCVGFTWGSRVRLDLGVQSGGQGYIYIYILTSKIDRVS